MACVFLGGCRGPIAPPPAARPVAGAETPRPGPQKDGSVLLPNQWALNPVGRQIVVGDFPVSLALHPGGRLRPFCIAATDHTRWRSSTCDGRA